MNKIVSNHIIEEYHRFQNIENKKITKILGPVSLVTFFLTIIAGYLSLNAKLPVLVFYILLGVFLFDTFLYVMIFFFFKSEKPFYRYLMKLVLDGIAFDDGWNITYTPYPKSKEILKESRIYPQSASFVTRYQFDIITNNDIKASVFDTYSFSQAGKTTVLHLNGLHIVYHKNQETSFQLRTTGSPNRKGEKLMKIPQKEKLNAFVSQTDQSIDEKYYKVIDFVNEETPSKGIFLSSTNDGLHIAFDVRRMMRNIKALDQEIYKELYNWMYTIVQMVDAISIKIEE